MLRCELQYWAHFVSKRTNKYIGQAISWVALAVELVVLELVVLEQVREEGLVNDDAFGTLQDTLMSMNS